MANFIDEIKTSVATIINDIKTLSVFSTDNKEGALWLYNEADITYEMPVLTYNFFGNQLSIINELKI